MINTVIFDLGGVLLDWNPRYLYRKLLPDERAVETFLADVCTQDWNEQQDAGRSIAEANAELIARFPEQEALIAAYYARFDEMLAGAIEGTVDILEHLHQRGDHNLLALTNFSAETFPIARARFPFLERFADILVSGEVGTKKPDPAIFDMLLSRHGLQPCEAVFIDDAAHNIAAAGELGLRAVHFRAPDQLREDLRALGVNAG